MPEPPIAVCFTRDATDVANRVVVILNAAQTTFEFRSTASPLELPAPDLSGTYSWNLLGSVMAEEKRKLGAKYLFGVLDQPIENNWFSRTVHDESICFITTKDWEYLSELPLIAFVAYEITENLVEMLIGDIEAHVETRGCLFDMVAIKPHISFKLRTADICTECTLLLNEKLKPPVISSVIAMLEAVRLVALGRAQHRSENPAVLSLAEAVDREFPFPLAYCFRSMQAELTYSRKWLKALELYEVIIKYVSFVLLSAFKAQGTPSSVDVQGLRRPAAGHWHAACFGLLSMAKDSSNAPFIHRYLDTLDRNLIRRSHAASERLLPLRNDTKGHGFVEEEVNCTLD